MRISDWSSDVCSSDLRGHPEGWINAGAFFVPVFGATKPIQTTRWAVRSKERSPQGGDIGRECTRYRKVHRPRRPWRRRTTRFALFTRSEEHTSELQSLMRISYAVFCLKKKKTKYKINRQQ